MKMNCWKISIQKKKNFLLLKIIYKTTHHISLCEFFNGFFLIKLKLTRPSQLGKKKSF